MPSNGNAGGSGYNVCVIEAPVRKVVPSQYLSIEEARQYEGRPIGSDRLLTVFEEDWMLSSGLNRADITEMTPEELRTHAESVTESSDLFLGS